MRRSVPDPEMLVIGNDDPCVRLVAAKHHVTAGLSPENESGALQGGADIPARQIGGELGHVVS
jgi:hypothetical protein